ncbi:MAG: ribulose-phosphate 3-epimerase [Mycoplasmataceae bacterium]|nr:ribulose-phosphate 3-epimerase [Mycoplasmataceae bacterium]
MFEKMITPSILNVEKDKREDVINELINLGIKWFHFDVMDNKFVPNNALTIEEIISYKKKFKKISSDAHLMVSNPFEYAKQLSDYVECLTIHYESFDNEEDIKKFVNEFCHTNWIGLAIKPSTPISKIQHLVYLFDIVLIMSVEPGFGGQKFIDESIEKVKELKKFIDEDKLHTIIQIDGGINSENSKKLFELGTTLNVVGSFLIKNISKETLLKLKKN